MDQQPLMQSQNQPPQTAPEETKGFSAQGEKFIQTITEKVEPKDRESLDRVVLAGQKFMFSKETHGYMQQILDAEGDMSEKLGMGIVQLMAVLMQQSKGNMPPQIIMPAAAILLAKACEYIERTGGEMNTEIFGNAMKIMAVGLHKMMSKSMGQVQEGQPQAGATPEQPAPSAQQPPPMGV